MGDFQSLANDTDVVNAEDARALQHPDHARGRGCHGPLAYRRATDHARAMHEAIHCGASSNPRMRALAPDLSLAPLLEP